MLDNEEATTALKAAMRISPHYPTWLPYNLAKANLWLGNFAVAQEAAETYLQQEPDEPYAYLIVATILGFQRRKEEVAGVVVRLREKFPAFGIKNIILSQRYKEREKLDRVIGVLRRAGLPG